MNRIPNVVLNLLNDYMYLWNERLPHTLEGLYLHGSIVLDAYTNNSSDIDFIAITKNRLSNDEIVVMTEIHKIISNKYIWPEMDGSYIVWEDLGKDETFDHRSYPFYNGGEIGYSTQFNPVTWWLLKTKGINILGQRPTDLNLKANKEDLVSYVLENMNSYWLNRVQRLEKSVEELLDISTKEEIDKEVEWTILGLLRQYYTVRERDIISKLGAGRYGLVHLPADWHTMIQEAINIRENRGTSLFKSEEDRIDCMLRFSKYLIGFCNQLMST
ncbi:DUF4111 domain-containing protein [Ornithinibacillus sp. L9]|uniref:DUF4111 domain-containing protein n=1 Tax=Ornithinibacillus caprae TaxID=2678566 RepID=A0A6N8FJ76_9BACI|nr:aminoglycoside adenylyltransferase domain-containing protein [Ornithinibacillus caprae]MUK87809.1 DUF4111 domain-containing protein [Ornithinibacillus caprae]